MTKSTLYNALSPLACLALFIGALVSFAKEHWILAILLFVAAVYLLTRLKRETDAMRLLAKIKLEVEAEEALKATEDAIKAARAAIIDLHMHAPDRAYFLARIDQAASKNAFPSIVEEAKAVATKHPLGMNI